MSVSMVALSSGRMLTVAGILVCSTSHTGSRDYNIRECESRLPGAGILFHTSSTPGCRDAIHHVYYFQAEPNIVAKSFIYYIWQNFTEPEVVVYIAVRN